mmetsp:Transcript_17887/g.32453  ORF Transcript_17887/g.32453 Transcript_17887/m.32453 type:complete len:226 (+) Transcript_17887:200-877(+)
MLTADILHSCTLLTGRHKSEHISHGDPSCADSPAYAVWRGASGLDRICFGRNWDALPLGDIKRRTLGHQAMVGGLDGHIPLGGGLCHHQHATTTLCGCGVPHRDRASAPLPSPSIVLHACIRCLVVPGVVDNIGSSIHIVLSVVANVAGNWLRRSGKVDRLASRCSTTCTKSYYHMEGCLCLLVRTPSDVIRARLDGLAVLDQKVACAVAGIQDSWAGRRPRFAA